MISLYAVKLRHIKEMRAGVIDPHIPVYVRHTVQSGGVVQLIKTKLEGINEEDDINYAELNHSKVNPTRGKTYLRMVPKNIDLYYCNNCIYCSQLSYQHDDYSTRAVHDSSVAAPLYITQQPSHW